MRKCDLVSIVVLGEIVAFSLVPFLIDTGLSDSASRVFGFNTLFILPVFIPLLALFGLWVLFSFSHRFPLLFQLGKFLAVGVANTAIDFGVFSLLKLVTNITFGVEIAGINIPGFSLAVVNSYFWNKFWTFEKKEAGAGAPREFFQFFVVSVIGAFINSAILFSLTTFVDPLFGLSPNLWATVSKGIATPISLVWNFVGYKFIVFK